VRASESYARWYGLRVSVDTKDLVTQSVGVFLANWKAALLGGCLSLIPAVGGLFVVNWLEAVKRNDAQGESIEIPPLLSGDNAFEKAQGSFLLLVFAVINAAVAALLGTIGIVVSIGGLIGLVVLGGIVALASALMADKPGLAFLPAMSGAFAFARAEPATLLKLTGVGLAIVVLGAVPLGLGLPVALPVASGMFYLAYRGLRPEVEAAAAAAGVELQ
jgi:hypothetical protein